MPQLPLVFEAYPATVVLDGSGNGSVQFQPNGCNVDVSRLFVNVSSSVKQATVTLYKQTISPTNVIGTIVSGSTGGLASGAIYLGDGTSLFVVWSGGDPGAIATATFSGRQISFSDMGTDSITWTDPIAASDGSLIFPAIKSPNYQAGVMGWSINRDGTFELSGGVFRGDVEVDGTNGSKVTITNTNSEAQISLYPPPYTDPTVNDNPATLTVARVGTGGGEEALLSIASPWPDKGPDSGDQSILNMQSGELNGSVGSKVDVVVTEPSGFTVNGFVPGSVNIVRFTSSGTYTPPAECKQLFVEVQGGGGAGGGPPATAAGQTSAGAGGGGGGYANVLLDATSVPANTTVTVGAGGTANVAAAGGNGGASSFGAFCAAGGGTGGGICIAGTGIQNAPSGVGGFGTIGDQLGGGSAGTWGARLGTTAGACIAGVGGGSVFGGGGAGGNAANGGAGRGWGGGGGGAANNPSNADRTGGIPSPGIVVITEIY